MSKVARLPSGLVHPLTELFLLPRPRLLVLSLLLGRQSISLSLCGNFLLLLHDERLHQLAVAGFLQGDGGVIALDRQGNIATPFNTTGMLTGAVHSDGKIKLSGWSKSAEPVVIPAR